MVLPVDFQFSQGSLQDFVDCRRRFQLRYIQRLAWPALQAEPALEIEAHIRKGALFHRMLQGHLLGIPAERLSNLASDPDLARWWQNYLDSTEELLGDPVGPGTVRYPEVNLATSLVAFRLVAKYDLLLLQSGGKMLIFDWKTSARQPKRDFLRDRLQTRVYPYLLVQAGAQFNRGEPLQPEDVEMVYWYAEYPDQPVRFPYSAGQFQADHEYLSDLFETIQGLAEDQFPLTDDERRCAYCVYRSLCDRGVAAGVLEAMDEDLQRSEGLEIELDFEQIAEIEF